MVPEDSTGCWPHRAQVSRHSEAFDESMRERHADMLKGQVQGQAIAGQEGFVSSSGVMTWAREQGEAARDALMNIVFGGGISDSVKQDRAAAEAAIDIFRARAATGTVVLRCVDPRLAKLGSQVLADLTSINWKGWAKVVKGRQARWLRSSCTSFFKILPISFPSNFLHFFAPISLHLFRSTHLAHLFQNSFHFPFARKPRNWPTFFQCVVSSSVLCQGQEILMPPSRKWTHEYP